MNSKEDLIMPYGISKLLTLEILSDIKKIAFSKDLDEGSLELKLSIIDNSVNLTYKGRITGIYCANDELYKLLIENEYILLYVLRMNFYTSLTMKVVPKPWGICEPLATYFVFPRIEEVAI